jgi:hypothetical protein
MLASVYPSNASLALNPNITPSGTATCQINSECLVRYIVHSMQLLFLSHALLTNSALAG